MFAVNLIKIDLDIDVWIKEGVAKQKNSEKRQIVGAAGFLARSTASSRNLLSILLQCRGQESPRLLQLAYSHSFLFRHTLFTV